MKFVQALCETVTRALGLSSLTGYDQDVPWQQPVGPHGPAQIRPIQGHEHLQGTPSREQKINTELGQPTEALHTLFPGDPFRQTGARKAAYGGEREDEIAHTNEKLMPGGPDAPKDQSKLPPGPIFAPPNATPGFKCNYTAMRGWKHVATNNGRNAWLEKPVSEEDDTGGIYNIFTNYDQYAPKGTLRQYHLNVSDHNINADGMNRPDGGKTFNEQFPGPWIEACWGDTVEITVENHLKYNGTAVHWHGVRMLNAFEYDGVNAVTQCAIAPGDSFTYRFRVTQYGTSWYHSHYSLQYADGLLGPITFHGPHAADYDVALDPFLFGDWSHNSAFEDYAVELRNPPAIMKTVILNGRGFYNCTDNPNPDCKGADKVDPPSIFEQTFEFGRRYLLRLINTSTASTFIFSIDKHMLQIVAADFVPIEPYYRDSILVGIGQRYDVIVQAIPSNALIPVEDQNYWIRITPAAGCDDIEPQQKNEKLGIIRYDEGNVRDPTTTRYRFDPTCADEPMESLVPVVPMDVGPAANSIDPYEGDNFELGLERASANHTVPHGNFTRWDILDTPMWLDLTDPLINHLHDPDWNPAEYALITEDYPRDDWVYIVMTAQGNPKQEAEGKREFIPVAHPMHLHGHDFVLLAQTHHRFHPDDVWNGTFKYKNPPRRDVVLLPRDGYVAVAFRPDNPGQWIMHCHIAWHASSGLALTIRENEKQIKLSKEVVKEKDRVCHNWHKWYNNTANWYNFHEFQEDSGI